MSTVKLRSALSRPDSGEGKVETRIRTDDLTAAAERMLPARSVGEHDPQVVILVSNLNYPPLFVSSRCVATRFDCTCSTPGSDIKITATDGYLVRRG